MDTILCESRTLGLSLLVRLLKMLDDSLVVLEPQARSLVTENTQKRNKAQALWAKRIRSAYIGVKEVRGQVPGTTRKGGRTKSTINNVQALGYVRAPPEGVAQCLALPRHRTEVPRYLTEALRYRSTAPVAGATTLPPSTRTEYTLVLINR